MPHSLSRNQCLSVTLAIVVATSCVGSGRRGASVIGRPPPVRRVRSLPGSRYEGDFRSRLRAADASQRLVALVDLTERVDLATLTKRLHDASASKLATRVAVVSALESVASQQQARLRPLLDRLQAQGAIGAVHSVAIVNRLIVEGTAAAVLEIGSSAEVAVVRPDWTSEHAGSQTEVVDLSASVPLGEAFQSWAVRATKADRLWSLGFDGTGVIVAAIDTGALESHEQLRDRRMPGERGWFDPLDGSTIATDRHGHGTGVLSQAVGGNPDGRVVGIAPGARWAAASGNRDNYYSRARMTLAADWALRIARPDVLVNAWSHHEGACNDFDLAFIQAWKASGIFVVFPAGNGGPERETGESPAQLPGVLSVAALGKNELPDALSSRGPSRCASAAFPSLAAPGADQPIASIGGPSAYVLGQGTSLSAAVIGGAAALLLQAIPETDPDTLERVLSESARDIAPHGRDEATGAGEIDLEAALTLLRARVAR